MHLRTIYPVTAICGVLTYPRSNVYAVSLSNAEIELRQAIQNLAGEYPTYGYRRITALLKRAGWSVNHKRVQRLMRIMGLAAAPPKRRKRTTNSQHSYPRYPNLVKGLVAAYPDHLWVCDITYVLLRYGVVYLAVIMDVYTRAIRGWYLGRSLDQTLTLAALERALATHVPDIHHSDQGVQYAATRYVALLERHGVQISMAAVGKPEENGFAERLIRTIREEEVQLTDYADYHDAYTHMGQFLEDVYNHKRIHSALGYLTPAEFEADWVSRQPETAAVH